MKLNVFKILDNKKEELNSLLLNNGYNLVNDIEIENYKTKLYLYKRNASKDKWLTFYNDMISQDIREKYSKDLDGASLAGVFIIETANSIFAVSHGIAHFIVRKFAYRDFGLDLAERIADKEGLSLKHSQTFTSAGQKDITAYYKKKKIDESYDYGEAFNYVKCKTVDREKWGDVIDFGESVRFTSNKNFILSLNTIYSLIDNIEITLKKEPLMRLPRYYHVKNDDTLKILNDDLNEYFIDYFTNLNMDDLWLTGVSFNFGSDMKAVVKIERRVLVPKTENLIAEQVKDAIIANKDIINGQYDKIMVSFYDEDDNLKYRKSLKELMQVTIEKAGKYYVFFDGKWFEFSESYIKYIEDKVDEIEFMIKDDYNKNENDLIDHMVSCYNYKKLHKKIVMINHKYQIEEADLMDEKNIIMVKDQNSSSDLVFLVKQATTSVRLWKSGDLISENIDGKNICLWMLLKRKKLTKLSDLKSFHVLDALNEFKKEMNKKGLKPVIWVSLNK